jgi:hypothetical protein
VPRHQPTSHAVRHGRHKRIRLRSPHWRSASAGHLTNRVTWLAHAPISIPFIGAQVKLTVNQPHQDCFDQLDQQMAQRLVHHHDAVQRWAEVAGLGAQRAGTKNVARRLARRRRGAARKVIRELAVVASKCSQLHQTTRYDRERFSTLVDSSPEHLAPQ